MRDLVAEREAVKYRHVFGLPDYRVACHGLTLWQTHRDLFPETVRSAVDLGCGTGRLVQQWVLEGIDAYGVDLVAEQSVDRGVYRGVPSRFITAPLWEMALPHVADVGVCADVLEHIPETHIRKTLARIAASCRMVVFQIAHMPHVLAGHTLHVTLRDRTWWVVQICSIMDGATTTHPTDDVHRSVLVWRAT